MDASAPGQPQDSGLRANFRDGDGNFQGGHGRTGKARRPEHFFILRQGSGTTPASVKLPPDQTVRE
jgi:hypothetical protein